ncbi:DUF4138 domain-containing protein [Maribacter sp. 2307ULW6-5]|uniref:DUF4138 domain-containing protein n=1 Tax=Maribacter sp. 2307ULW6-5 TaxID=3386275 RepID=UPI0039BD09DC
MALLQAKKDVESNLLVVTEDGAIYSWVLAYRDSLTQFHHFISPLNSINPQPMTKKGIAPKPIPQLERYDTLCEQLVRNTKQFHHIKNVGNIRLRMTHSIYHNAEVYVVYEIKNASSVPYQIDRLQLLRVLKKSRRKASHQETPIQPLHSFRMPKMVGQGNTIRFVVVYPKFTLGEHHTLKISLQEQNGSRNLIF